MKLHGRIVIWPANLDSTKSRKNGRKLAKGFAVQNPKLDEIHEASERLSLDAEPVPAKSRPANWWEKGGYLTVAKKGSRTTLLRSLAEGVKQTRSSKIVLERDRK